MHVRIVDPSAYTPPYDHALCAALGRAGVRTTLVTSDFPYGGTPEPDGYALERTFYPGARGPAGSRRRRAAKLLGHVPAMRRLARRAADADVVHFQWLAVQQLDAFLLPRDRPVVLTAHDVLPREPRRGQVAAQRRLYDRVDAVVVHSRHGRDRLVDAVGVDPDRVHVIPHGAFTHLAAHGPVPLPPELAATPPGRPAVLLFGLLRPYKGLDVLLDAWARLSADGDPGADLWVVGLPKIDVSGLRATAPPTVRWVPRFVDDAESAAILRRADLVVLPYREIDQSGVLFSAMGLGRPLVLSDVGGFGEVAADGGAELVPAGDAAALAARLRALVDDPARRDALAARSRDLAGGAYSWDAVAAAHRGLYEGLLAAR